MTENTTPAPNKPAVVGWWAPHTIGGPAEYIGFGQPTGVSYAVVLAIDADRDKAAAVAAERERCAKLLWEWRHLGYSRARDAETDALLAGYTPESA